MKDGNLGCTSELYIWNGFCVFWGSSFYTCPHSHNTLQVVLDIEKNFFVKDNRIDWTAYATVIIDAGHVHQFDSNNSIQLFLYLEKDSDHARQLQARYLKETPIYGLEHISSGQGNTSFFRELLAKRNELDMFRVCTAILNGLLDQPERLPFDQRVAEAVRFIKQAPLKDFKIKAVANHVALSESRLRHLFKTHMGQSMQSFVKWMRVIDALNEVLMGKKLVEIAYAHGFSDASHMTKSFIDVIGIPPSKVAVYKESAKIVSSRKVDAFQLTTSLWKDWSDSEVYRKINIKTHEKNHSN